MAPDPHLADYGWRDNTPHTEAYLYKPLQLLLRDFVPPPPAGQASPAPRPTVLDLGCGNGARAEALHSCGYEGVGVDPSASGIAQARRRLPSIPFHQAPADPAALAQLQLPVFDAVLSTEVVEHVYSPRQWAAAAYAVLKPGGVLICSTPYHGYLKNCALALSGKLDAHFTALWDGGHIKFWSRRTLTALLQEAGFQVVAFRGAGRWPWLWKSMLLAARKPLT
ncbi:bifunctional 2-polyprenyl-6-hydroxyphenol methylase/3-demethylubiquinol 3-O-methyltransferase UbiG [Synechococcus sp. EJ6-Ellesmere]|uniref:class I SAM-dependent methyltransferase n=1 Tax=Synechococcus sp. EJ6-Ellesmere TaxID=2823734 RepID=UPI0020CFDC3B|nr:class I SAM-dependent methyltransferase [Synechococcus sp. EJ6-Ellesmere]MCP9825036.1 class I SAM-dependent methyltransferase [Synechococcus sp. EJ6-Ellesmere]